MHASEYEQPLPYASPVVVPEPRLDFSRRSPGSGAGLLAGMLYGVPAGTVLAGLSTHWEPIAVKFGAIGGAVIGMIVGRAFGKFERVLSGVAFGAVAPLLLILIDGLRSGRLASARAADELFSAESLPLLAAIVGGGALIGGLLTATAKGFRWLAGCGSEST